MLTLQMVKDWLKQTIPEAEGRISVGAIDGDQPRYIGVYGRGGGKSQRICIGGGEQTRYQEKRAAILIHWTGSPVMAEKKALEVYELLYGLSEFTIQDADGSNGDVRVASLDPGEAPVPLGPDRRGIYEYVIEITIQYERND